MELYSAIIEFLKTVSKGPLWLTLSITVAGLIALYIPELPGFDLTPLRKDYGIWIALGTLVALVCSIFLVFFKVSDWFFRSCQEKSKPPLIITVNSAQKTNCWSTHTQPDGDVYSQLSLNFTAHNKSNDAIYLHSPVLIVPRVGTKNVQQIVLEMGHMGGNEPLSSSLKNLWSF